MIESGLLLILPFLLGYVEMHYRFPFFPFSRYFRREPEILADAPYRVGPGKTLPITILIKDADRFPVTLHSIKVCGNGREYSFEKIKEYNQKIEEHWFEDIIEYKIDEYSGILQLEVTFYLSIENRRRTVVNHNVKTTAHFLLETYIDNQLLPGSEQYWFGDLHYHSGFTEDFVEFGAPLNSTAKAAECLGLDFLAITDHSYDLDDKKNSWVEYDPNLKKWHTFLETVHRANADSELEIIPGEEISCRNINNKNVHLLMLNNLNFIHGSGDGAEHFFRTGSEHSIAEICKHQLHDSLTIAAHPFQSPSLLERFLLNRGKWKREDIDIDGITGLQILNGRFDQSFFDSLVEWTQLLLCGKKVFIYAGNDAHGNFNRFHQIKWPMWSTHQRNDQILGQCRTGIIKTGNKTGRAIIDALRNGKCFITNGPTTTVYLHSNTESYTLGDTSISFNNTVNINCFSSLLYGPLANLILYKGIIGERSETKILDHSWDDNSLYETLSIDIKWGDSAGYLRCQLSTAKGFTCFTNPIWIDPGSDR